MMTETIKNISQSEYELILSSDASGNPLNGSRNYVLRLSHDIPSCKYWSVIVYDLRSRLIIKNHQLWPSVHSNCHNLAVNSDGSIDIWFGPEIATGREHNSIQTIRRQDWYAIIRLYDITDKLTVNDWAPGHIEQTEIM